MPQASLPEKDIQAQKSWQAYRQALGLDSSLLNAAGLAVITTTPSGPVTSINQAAITLLGYSSDEIVGQTTAAIFLDTDEVQKRAGEYSKLTGKVLESAVDVIVQKAWHQKTPDRTEWTFVRKDGSRFHGSLTLISVRDKDDNVVGFAGIITDLTAQLSMMPQVEISKQLRQLAEENMRFFNSPVNLNAVVNFEGKLERISPSWPTIVGWSEQELRSQPFLNFIHPDDRERVKEELNFLTSAKSVHTFENRLACQDGSYRWLLWALAPDHASGLVYASAIDISERKKSEEKILHSKSDLESITLHLQEQNRKLDEFAHIISHNLRAPVNNIQALINLLDEKSTLNDYKLIFGKLSKVSKNLGETMNELMDTLKAKAEPDVDLAEIRFKEVLDKVVQSLEGELIMVQASVTFDFNEAPTIRYSKPYLESIFQNLLTNAVKYRSPDRTPLIHFRSFYTDSHMELEVTDNGQGIDMNKFGDKLFGLHKTFHKHHEARGVGLFLVKTQIEALGGSIRVASEVDKGTTFTIRFK